MSLNIGQTLAHYEILEPIGKGGMGEVYRAKDGKLGRDVAIKVLPDEFAQDEERLRRFQREAKVLAALNHPNIASIYGLEQAGDTHYLVLELVPGETLAERIGRGPIPVAEALEIATKIAEALEEAHEQGIVHRDLKPANIKLTEDDKIKVLDFGLAKAFVEDEDAGDSTTSMSPTITRDATRMGVILGTAAYMSPEQAKGKRVDKRADIWAFGVVLYEMLTGARAFAGEDVSDTLAYVLTKEPDWAALPAALSPTLRTYLMRCLEKNPKRRVRDIGDVRLAIDGAYDVGASESLPAGLSASKLGLAALVLSAIIASVAVLSLVPGRAAPDSPVRFTLDATGLAPFGGEAVTISPDGSRVLFRADAADGVGQQLYVRSFDALEAEPVRGTDQARFAAISRDGAWVAFSSTDTSKIMKVPISGGVAATLAELPNYSGNMTWIDEDRLLVAVRSLGLFEVFDDAREPVQVTVVDADRDEGLHVAPSMIVRREAALFVIPGASQPEIAVVDLVTHEVTRLGLSGRKAHYANTGHLVYVGVDQVLRAVPFDADRLAVTGDPVALLEGILDFSLSDTGRLAYATNAAAESRKLVWVDRTGREEAFDPPIAPDGYVYPRLSPEGDRLAVAVSARRSNNVDADLWVIDLARGARTRITFGGNNRFFPTWTSDGANLTFTDGNGADNSVLMAPSDGSGTIETLLDRDTRRFPTSWASDGSHLALYVDQPETGRDIWTLTADGALEPFLVTRFQERAPTFSPDGRWLAYVSNKSGRDEVYVRPFPASTQEEHTISTGGGREPLWSRDGRELFYRDGEAIMAVAVETEGGFRAGVPEVLFEGYVPDPASTSAAIANYDITPDGERFVMVKRGQDDTATDEDQVVVILNWFEELKRLAPTP